jgi:hypothetical protein
MCFVWISEQTASISLYSINWLVFITDAGCVYCAVWTEYFCIIHVNFHLDLPVIIFFPVSIFLKIFRIHLHVSLT